MMQAAGFMRMLLASITVSLLLAGCGVRGNLKNPAEAQAQQEKRERKKTQAQQESLENTPSPAAPAAPDNSFPAEHHPDGSFRL